MQYFVNKMNRHKYNILLNELLWQDHAKLRRKIYIMLFWLSKSLQKFFSAFSCNEILLPNKRKKTFAFSFYNRVFLVSEIIFSEI